jgi:hypothetical protein
MNKINIEELLKRQEPLCKELKSCLTKGPLGKMICHSLVHDIIYTEQMNAMLNERLRCKKEMLIEAEKKKKWSSYLFIHERPYRLEAFLKIVKKLSDKEYWELLREVWEDSENIWQCQENWDMLINLNRPCRESFMTPEEREFLKNLPEKVTIYRGYVKGHNEEGKSYTLSKEKAKWFSERFTTKKDMAAVKKIVVSKKKIFAYLKGRSEEEIILK